MEEAGYLNCVSVPDGAPSQVAKEIPNEGQVCPHYFLMIFSLAPLVTKFFLVLLVLMYLFILKFMPEINLHCLNFLLRLLYLSAN